jgi:uncharacterized protein (DUF2384 family)
MLRPRSNGARSEPPHRKSVKALRKALKRILGDQEKLDRWLDTNNDQLAGQKPGDLLNGSDEQRRLLEDLVDAIAHGMPT